MQSVLAGEFGFDAGERSLHLEARTVEENVCLLQQGSLFAAEARSFQPDKIQPSRSDAAACVEKKRSCVPVHAGFSTNHRQTPDFGILMNRHSAGNESLVFDFDISGDQGTTADHGLAAHLAVVGDMSRG